MSSVLLLSIIISWVSTLEYAMMTDYVSHLLYSTTAVLNVKKNIYSYVTTGTHRNKGRGFVLCDLSRTLKHRSLTGCRCSVSLESIDYMATGLLKQKR